jgi:hypothetical protein
MTVVGNDIASLAQDLAFDQHVSSISAVSMYLRYTLSFCVPVSHCPHPSVIVSLHSFISPVTVSLLET